MLWYYIILFKYRGIYFSSSCYFTDRKIWFLYNLIEWSHKDDASFNWALKIIINYLVCFYIWLFSFKMLNLEYIFKLISVFCPMCISKKNYTFTSWICTYILAKRIVSQWFFLNFNFVYYFLDRIQITKTIGLISPDSF